MAMTFSYRDRNTMELERVQAVLDRCAKLPGYRTFNPDAVHDAFFERETLRPLRIPQRGATIGAVDIKGEVKNKEPFKSFVKILSAGAGAIGAFGTLRVKTGFEERNSRQRKSNADEAELIISEGISYFHYSAGGSKVGRELDYRKEFMRELAESLLLPLSFRADGGNFFLAHASGGEFKTLRAGIDDENPSDFQVSLPDLSVLEMVDVLERFLASYAGRYLYHRWIAHPIFDGRKSCDMKKGPRIFQEAVRVGLPADRYEIHMIFQISEVGAVEFLRSLCGSGDEIFLTLASFELTPENPVNVRVVASAAGYQVELESRLPLDAEEVDQLLGLNLSKEGGG